jgi:SEL1 protein
MFLYSDYGVPRDIKRSFDYFQQLADVHGNSTAHHYLALLYSTGLGGIPIDTSKAVLHQSFAARFGNKGAKMALAYRYAHGIGTPEHCTNALYLYRSLADDAMKEYHDGPIGGHFLPPLPVRLWENHGGAYGVNIDPKGDENTQDQNKMANIIEYLRHKANKGDDGAMLFLAIRLYNGNIYIKRDHAQAYSYLQKIYTKYQEHDDPKVLGESKSKLFGQACGLLGVMHLRGEHVEKSNSTAADYFLKGAKFNDGQSQTWVGIMLMEGNLETEPGNDPIKTGVDYLKKGQENNYPLAMIKLGLYYLDINLKYSSSMFLSAYSLGSYEGAYRLAQSIDHSPEMCHSAIKYYSIVVNRMDWSYSPHREGLNSFKADDYENALIHYIEQAEMGLEIAQSNVAWLIDNDYSLDSIQLGDRKNWLALLYWTRSSNHEVPSSILKMGDYYYEGKGAEKNPAKAFSCYSQAAHVHQSSMGCWNLGWMHENGIGAPKDFYLAKRYYDLAYHYNNDASFPVTLSLIKLNFKFFYNYLFHGADSKSVSSFMNPTQPNMPVKENEKAPSNDQDKIGEESTKKKSNVWQQWTGENDENENDMNNTHSVIITISSEQIIIMSLCLLIGYLIYLRQNRLNQPLVNNNQGNSNNNNNQRQHDQQHDQQQQEQRVM